MLRSPLVGSLSSTVAPPAAQ